MSEKKIIEEIKAKLNVDFNTCNDIYTKPIIENVKKLNSDIDVINLIIFLINKIEEINDTKNIVYEFLFTKDKNKGDKKINQRIKSDLGERETKIINELKNIIINIENKEQKKMEEEINKLKNLFEEYAKQINQYIEYLFGQVNDIHRKTQDIDQIKKLNTLVDSVKKELDQKIKDLEEKIAENIDIKNVNNELKKNNSEINDKIEKLTIDNKNKDKKISEINGQIDKLTIDNKNKDKKISEINDQIDKLTIDNNNLKKEINDLEFRIQENNIDKYILEGLKSDINRITKENERYKKEMEKKFNKLLEEKTNERFLSLIESTRNLVFIENRDNMKSIIFIILMLKAQNLNDIQNKKNEYLINLYNDEKITSQFKNFIRSINASTNESNSNAHEGFEKDILSNIFNLFGIETKYIAKYNSFFNDDIIKKVKALIKKIYHFKINGLNLNELENEFNNLKKLVNQKKFDELFNQY